jgi:hypothetical protein
MGEISDRIYVCPRCFEVEAQAGKCPRDGAELVRCEPGSTDDPCRKPLMDRQGRVLTRAPRWWLQHTMRQLMLTLERRSASNKD